jgi:hypothetical protein
VQTTEVCGPNPAHEDESFLVETKFPLPEEQTRTGNRGTHDSNAHKWDVVLRKSDSSSAYPKQEVESCDERSRSDRSLSPLSVGPVPTPLGKFLRKLLTLFYIFCLHPTRFFFKAADRSCRWEQKIDKTCSFFFTQLLKLKYSLILTYQFLKLRNIFLQHYKMKIS